MLRVSVGLLVIVVVAPATAAADETQLGAFFGPRIFSQKSALGYIDEAPAHPMLVNGVMLGARIAREFGLPWLFPELEIAFCPTKTTTPMNAIPADIYWIDPRVQLRFELMRGRRAQPFLIVGGGV